MPANTIHTNQTNTSTLNSDMDPLGDLDALLNQVDVLMDEAQNSLPTSVLTAVAPRSSTSAAATPAKSPSRTSSTTSSPVSAIRKPTATNNLEDEDVAGILEILNSQSPPLNKSPVSIVQPALPPAQPAIHAQPPTNAQPTSSVQPLPSSNSTNSIESIGNIASTNNVTSTDNIAPTNNIVSAGTTNLLADTMSSSTSESKQNASLSNVQDISRSDAIAPATDTNIESAPNIEPVLAPVTNASEPQPPPENIADSKTSIANPETVSEATERTDTHSETTEFVDSVELPSDAVEQAVAKPAVTEHVVTKQASEVATELPVIDTELLAAESLAAESSTTDDPSDPSANQADNSSLSNLIATDDWMNAITVDTIPDIPDIPDTFTEAKKTSETVNSGSSSLLKKPKRSFRNSKLFGLLVKLASKMLYGVSKTLVSFMTALDRPFAKIGTDYKAAFGYAAMSTLALATAIWIYSFIEHPLW